MAAANEHRMINNKGLRNDANKSARSPPKWKNKFVSYKSSLWLFFFMCKGYGHRASVCKKGSKNDKVHSLEIEMWSVIDVIHMDIVYQLVEIFIDLLPCIIERDYLLLSKKCKYCILKS